MKIKEGFRLRTVGDSNIVVPTGKARISFNGMITLNATGSFVWRSLEKGMDAESTAKALSEEYGIDMATAREDVAYFYGRLSEAGLVE